MKSLLQFNIKKNILIISLIFSVFVFLKAETYAVQTTDQNQLQQANEQVRTDKLPENSKIFATEKTPEKNMETTNASTLNTLKSNTLQTKNTTEGKSKIIKFLIAMVGVLLSSLAIFGGLKVYETFILKKGAVQNKKSKKIDSLETPKTFKEAINIFLDKTDK